MSNARPSLFRFKMKIAGLIVVCVAACLPPRAKSFVLKHTPKPLRLAFSASSTTEAASTIASKSPENAKDQLERKGIGHALLDFALKSPLWSNIMVPAARQKIIDTAEANGIPWHDYVKFLQSQEAGPWNQSDLNTILRDLPEWYAGKSYHGYDTGHLNWRAAMEMEVAAASIGARNLPKAGRDGETAWRELFFEAFRVAGAISCEEGAVIVDIGCATGALTRMMAKAYPKAGSIIGIDLSPYYIATAKYLLELAPSKNSWVVDIEPDNRIQFLQQDASKTDIDDNSVDIVSLQFVTHETPAPVAIDLMRETLRILKPGGQLWFCEMDFESPHFAKQRGNPLLFSLLRATEPFLDEYAEGQPAIWSFLRENFGSVTIVPATGRHFACVCTKGGSNKAFDDQRFNEDGQYRVEDTHLQVWENSRN